MRYETKNKELRERAIANASELLKLNEPPVMSTFLWCKVQSMAEFIKAGQKENKDVVTAEIYKGVMYRRKISRRIMRLGHK